MKQYRHIVLAVILMLTMSAASPSLSADSWTLEDLCRIALTSSEKLKLAEQNIEIAEIGARKARGYLYPRVTATGGVTQYSERKYTGNGGILQPESASVWGLRLDETLSLSGRELTALEISRQTVLKNRYDVEALRDDFLLGQVAAAYYDVLLAMRNVEIADANVERLVCYRDAARKRLRIGDATKTALLRAESELSGAMSDQIQARNTLDMVTTLLSSNVGIQPPFTLMTAPPAKVDVPDLASLREQALVNRAEIRSLRMQKKMAAGQIRFAEGAFMPSVTFTAAYVGAAQNPATSSLNPESFYGGLSLNFPLFDGGIRSADVAEAKIRERQADLRIEEMKKAIDIELKAAHLELSTQAGILRFLEDQLLFARDNYQAVLRQFEMGLANSLDVADANTLLVSSERKTAASSYRLQLAALRLKKAAGRPWAMASVGAPPAESAGIAAAVLNNHP